MSIPINPTLVVLRKLQRRFPETSQFWTRIKLQIATIEGIENRYYAFPPQATARELVMVIQDGQRLTEEVLEHIH